MAPRCKTERFRNAATRVAGYRELFPSARDPPGTLSGKAPFDGKLISGGALDAGHPYGGKVRQAAFLLPRELEDHPVRLVAEIETKGGIRRPVRWACEQPLEPDGSFRVEVKRQSDPDWRKGI